MENAAHESPMKRPKTIDALPPSPPSNSINKRKMELDAWRVQRQAKMQSARQATPYTVSTKKVRPSLVAPVPAPQFHAQHRLPTTATVRPVSYRIPLSVKSAPNTLPQQHVKSKPRVEETVDLEMQSIVRIEMSSRENTVESTVPTMTTETVTLLENIDPVEPLLVVETPPSKDVVETQIEKEVVETQIEKEVVETQIEKEVVETQIETILENDNTMTIEMAPHETTDAASEKTLVEMEEQRPQEEYNVNLLLLANDTLVHHLEDCERRRTQESLQLRQERDGLKFELQAIQSRYQRFEAAMQQQLQEAMDRVGELTLELEHVVQGKSQEEPAKRKSTRKTRKL